MDTGLVKAQGTGSKRRPYKKSHTFVPAQQENLVTGKSGPQTVEDRREKHRIANRPVTHDEDVAVVRHDLRQALGKRNARQADGRLGESTGISVTVVLLIWAAAFSACLARFGHFESKSFHRYGD